MLDISIEEQGDTIYFALTGRLDGGPGCRTLCETVKSEITQGHQRFVIDLEGVKSMSSCGIGCLVSSYASIKKIEGSMVLLSPNERVMQALIVTRLVPTVFEVIQTHAHQ